MRVLKWIGVGLLVLVASFFAWVYFSTFHPAQIESETVHSRASAPVLKPGQSLKVLSWNVQFMAGNQNNHFFYDDGHDPWPASDTVERVTKEVAEFIARHDPDIVMLQEVDDIADRTHNRDQSALLRELLPQYLVHTETFYWKAAYVPHPQINGRVGMKLLIMSKYAIGSATRYALPVITSDDILRQQFNLKRAMQQVNMPLTNGQELVLINTHLSAFAKGTDTMERQVAALMQRIESLPESTPWLVGGDFNLLPNEAAMASFEEGRSNYNDQGTELVPLISAYPSMPSLTDIESNPEPWFTYMPPTDPARKPDRTIDYIFYSPNLTVQHGEVLRGDALALSDHLPLLLQVQLPE